MLSFLLSLQGYASSDKIAHAGRLVDTSGVPTSGQVDLRFELYYSSDTTDLLCAVEHSSVSLTNGVYHVELDFSSGPESCVLNEVIETIPTSESLVVQVHDITNSLSYDFQNIVSVPMAFHSRYAEQAGSVADGSITSEKLDQMGADSGEALIWNGSQWSPGQAGEAGTVTSVNAGEGLSVTDPENDPTLDVNVDDTTIEISSDALQVKDGGITSAKIGDNQVTASKIPYHPEHFSDNLGQLDILLAPLGPIYSTPLGLNISVDNSTVEIDSGNLQVPDGGIGNDQLASGIDASKLTIGTLDSDRLDTGTGANQIVQVGADGNLPTLDGRNLINLPVVESQDTLCSDGEYLQASGNTFVCTSAGSGDGDFMSDGSVAMTGALSFESQDGAANYVELRQPTLASDIYFVLPSEVGSDGEVLSINTDQELVWIPASTGSVTAVTAVAPLTSTEGDTPEIELPMATSGQDGYLSSSDWQDFSDKQDALPSGSLSQYLRGDHTLADFEADVQSTELSGFSSTVGTLSTADSVVGAISKLHGNLEAIEEVPAGGTAADYLAGDNTWQELNPTAVGLGNVTNDEQIPLSALSTDTSLGVSDTDVPSQNAVKTYVDDLISSSISDASDDYLLLDGTQAMAGTLNLAQNNLRFENATNNIELRAPASIASDYILTLPEGPGATGQVLSSDGVGVLSWVSPEEGTVTEVSGSGPIDVSDGTTTPTVSISQASDSTDGYLSSIDWDIFNSKQDEITTGPTDEYFRGDLSLSDFGADVQSTALSNFISATGVITTADTVVGAISKLDGNFDAIEGLPAGGDSTHYLDGDRNWVVLDNDAVGLGNVTNVEQMPLSYLDTSTNLGSDNEKVPSQNAVKVYVDDLIANSISDASDDYLLLDGTQAMAGTLNLAQNNLRFENATNNIELQAPATITDNYTLTLPENNGTTGQVLSTDGTGVLSWVTPEEGTVTQVSGTGPISVSDGTTTPEISITQADNLNDGYLHSDDWNTFNDKQDDLDFASATGNDFLDGSGTWRNLSQSDIPNLSANKITSDTLHQDRVPAAEGLNTSCVSGQGLLSDGSSLNCTDSTSFGPWINNGLDIYYNTGDVGIGVTAPEEKLHVAGAAIVGSDNIDSVLSGQGSFQANSPLADTGHIATPWIYARAIEGDQRGSSATAITLGSQNGFTDNDEIGFITSGNLQALIDPSGNMGIGTPTPNAKLDIEGGIAGKAFNSTVTPQRFEWGEETIDSSEQQADYFWVSINFKENFSSPPLVYCTVQTANGAQVPRVCDVKSVTTSGFELGFCEPEYDNGSIDYCDSHSAESVGWFAIGEDTGADLAEYYESHQYLEAGEIVMPDKSHDIYVERSRQSDEKRSIGVVSTRPGLIIGEQTSSSYPIVLSGRVPVKVNMEGGEIQIGDRIALSNVDGIGKKADYKSERIIGIALEPATQKGEVMTFIDLQDNNFGSREVIKKQGQRIKNLEKVIQNQEQEMQKIKESLRLLLSK